MAHIVKFRLLGYRAVSAAIELQGLSTYVALYGDNAVGKSSVLHAVSLFGRLCATHPAQLLGSGRPWPTDAFFERFDEDPWMFNTSGSPTVELAATMNTGLEVSLRLTRVQEGIEIICLHTLYGGVDLAVELETARRALVAAEEEHARSGSEPDDKERRRLEELSNRRLEEVSNHLTILYERLVEAWAPIKVAMGLSPVVPVPDPSRAALFGAMNSARPALRAAVRTIMRRFGVLFPALGDGEMDVLENPPKHEKDLAWVKPTSIVPLDHLGSGVQSVVATLEALLLKQASMVCLDEPEAFVGALALDELASIFRGAAVTKICDQVWIATHAITLVGAEDPIVVLERSDGVVSVRQGSAAQLGGRFAQPAVGVIADRLGRLGQDGSVRLPPAVVLRAGLRPGDFVYFKEEPAGIRILTGEQADRMLSVETDEP